jgi:hypothetical protein
MRTIFSWSLAAVFLALPAAQVTAQDARQFVQQAVQNELAKDQADHSHWLYFEIDQKPSHPVRQWVAETSNGNLQRVVQIDGQPLSPSEQQQRVNKFLSDPSAQARQRKSDSHDDKEATEMLEMLPKAFIWTKTGGRELRPGCTSSQILTSARPTSNRRSSPPWKATWPWTPTSCASPHCAER